MRRRTKQQVGHADVHLCIQLECKMHIYRGVVVETWDIYVGHLR